MELDPVEVLRHLNALGYENVEPHLLQKFMKGMNFYRYIYYFFIINFFICNIDFLLNLFIINEYQFKLLNTRNFCVYTYNYKL